ncbi:hypothetical protein BU16DRAFT_617958 [Lophium mytilinum]|uniref:Uncharacterized protein n=1 Tax=Lophium mytilinum TaxID=390894 RepID=A0A6A6QSG6_9PEZI|nr:hypothetical protein BU16DRAFT_617958 [Lophium mytilinum]
MYEDWYNALFRTPTPTLTHPEEKEVLPSEGEDALPYKDEDVSSLSGKDRPLPKEPSEPIEVSQGADFRGLTLPRREDVIASGILDEAAPTIKELITEHGISWLADWLDVILEEYDMCLQGLTTDQMMRLFVSGPPWITILKDPFIPEAMLSGRSYYLHLASSGKPAYIDRIFVISNEELRLRKSDGLNGQDMGRDDRSITFGPEDEDKCADYEKPDLKMSPTDQRLFEAIHMDSPVAADKDASSTISTAYCFAKDLTSPEHHCETEQEDVTPMEPMIEKIRSEVESFKSIMQASMNYRIGKIQSEVEIFKSTLQASVTSHMGSLRLEMNEKESRAQISMDRNLADIRSEMSDIKSLAQASMQPQAVEEVTSKIQGLESKIERLDGSYDNILEGLRGLGKRPRTFHRGSETLESIENEYGIIEQEQCRKRQRGGNHNSHAASKFACKFGKNNTELPIGSSNTGRRIL